MGEDEKLFPIANEVMNKIELGRIKSYVSSIVLLEVYYVMTSVYRVERELVNKSLEDILQTRGLVLVEETDLRRALKWNKETNLRLADCLIMTQVPEGVYLCSFDADLLKIFKKGFGLTPDKLVEKVS